MEAIKKINLDEINDSLNKMKQKTDSSNRSWKSKELSIGGSPANRLDHMKS